MDKWDKYFMELAKHVASLSKDESTKIGAVIVGPDREIRSTGYNSFPRGVNDDNPSRQTRPLKYKWIEHAERNAIYNAARIGVSLKGCALYCSQWIPCTDCARAIIQSGITEVIVETIGDTVDRWRGDFEVSLQMFAESGVTIREMTKD